MPMINDLIEQLNENPPQNEQELNAMLGETGYSLTTVEPTMPDEEEEGMEMMGEDEEMEAEEDMGPMEEGEEEGDGAMEMEIIKEMMPMGAMMDDAPKGVNPRMMMQARTRKAAKKAIKEG